MKNLEKLLVGAVMLGLSGCSSGPQIKTSPEVMRDNYHIQGQTLPEVKLSPEQAMYGVEVLKRVYECDTEQCIANRPIIPGYDAFDEKTKEKALVKFIKELSSTEGIGGAERILTGLEWRNKTWIAQANIADAKYNALLKDIGTTAFWTAVLAFYSGNQVAITSRPPTSVPGNSPSPARIITTGTN